ncbi:RHS repeat-associated core domain-containing protein [Clostridium sp.]|uniref:RHS repeat-associated core domain-containing protein n=1 Tax=Clostridium sp. TaxID=1506 RepID=UPI002FC9FB4D
MEYVNVPIPGTENTVRAIKLNKGQSIPNIWSPLIALKPSTNYVLEFDYWSEEQEVQFNVDLFPDTLPERYPVAKTTVQKFKETISSASPDMTASSLRFFNNLSNPNPANIYITNIRVYEEGKTSEVNKEYFYVRNAQGDIISLVDKYGREVVNYTYDTWGKLISIEGTLKDTVGVKNPYRYRGYRYDTETGLYYLNSRYYNQEWGRFINADGITGVHGELLSHNMFAYCDNNPVNKQDPSGFLSFSATDGVGAGSDSYFSSVVSTLKKVNKQIQKNTLILIVSTTIVAGTMELGNKLAKKRGGNAFRGSRNLSADFKNGKKLSSHFTDHRADFGYKTADEYLEGARNFVMKKPTSTTQSFVSKEGTYFRYDTKTNEFGMVNQYGGISTYFKPTDGMKYWQEQIAKYKP